MSRERKILVWNIVLMLVLGAAAISLRLVRIYRLPPIVPVTISGAVLTAEADPRKQTPVAGATVTIRGGQSSPRGGQSSAQTISDSAGHFAVTLLPGVEPHQPVTLSFTQAEHKPLEITEVPRDQLYIIRMEPLVRARPASQERPNLEGKPVQIKNLRVRYSLKDQTIVNVGTVARQFDVFNTGNVPCQERRPCSPDGKWKAATGSLSLDAQDGNEFRNLRVSCIAGPCPFTSIQPDTLPRPQRNVTISALNWSDTASFLVEAEVIRNMPREFVRLSYPFIIGQTMTFALPAEAEGPSIQADLNNEEIIFPLGPKLVLSWATCSVELPPGGNRIYRCELKPGYQFQQ
jgi:hypothetical protein